ncbi:GPW/gp25 family protein [Desulfatitalea tepidiphila]|uniref:GPW/gp25 family protein n=1 Tax=Desulfatitalea tepidiphila TaxID=1185843 RepID=UPI0006B4D604|nr:GPW/gp25 family protein [Desulfatitalea tepidiphila]
MNIDYPFRFDHRGRTALTDYDEHIRDMIEQFLFTNTGERVNRPDFGSGVLQLVFAPNSPELASTLQFTLQAGLTQWLGDLIEVRKLEVVSLEATIQVEIQYLVRRTQEARTTTLVRRTAS